MHEIIWYQGRSGLAAVEGEWRLVVAGMNGPRLHHQYEWYQSYLDAAEDPDSVFFVLVRRGTRPVALCPLERVQTRLLGVTVTFLIQPELYVCQDFVYSAAPGNELILVNVLDFVRGPAGIDHDILWLDRVREDAGVRFSFNASPPSRSLLGRLDCSADICCHGGYEQVLGQTPAKFRANLRAAGRRLASLKEPEFTYARTADELESALAVFLRLEASGWKKDQGAIAADEETVHFYRAVIRHFGQTGRCEITLLWQRDRCIAGQLAVFAGRTLAVLKTAYDEEFARCSPGHLMLEHTVRRSAGSCTTDWIDLISDPEWCNPWRPRRTQLFSLAVFQDSRVARLLRQLYRAKEAVLRAATRIRLR